MRRAGFHLLCSFAILNVLACAVLQADIVYMRDGSTRQGRVSRQDGKILVVLADGQQITLSDEDVIYVQSDGPETASAPFQPLTQPATTSQPATGQAAPTAPAPAYVPDRVTQPETPGFMAMRNLAAAHSGRASFELRRQLEQWRIAAHDRRRKVGSEWLVPDDFFRRRKAFGERLAEAQELSQLLLRQPSTPHAQAVHRRNKALLEAKNRQAAGDWADSLLRSYLLGLAEYEADNYRQAEPHLRRCCSEAPYVAGFQQAYGLVLLKLDRPYDALEPLMKLARLRRGVRGAIDPLRQALQQVGGARINDPQYLEAQKLLSAAGAAGSYGSSSYRRRGNTWFMPGDEWQAYQGALPQPPYDRLVFQQAVAVAVSANSLLVDQSVVKDAVEAVLVLDAKTFIPVTVRRSSGYGISRSAPLLMTSVQVAGYEFTPAGADPNAPPALPQTATAKAGNLFAEMGSQVRTFPCKLERRDDGSVSVLGGLAAGETAAPVLDEDGRLLGFLAGKTDLNSEGGGEDRFIELNTLAPLFKSYSSYGSPAGGAPPKLLEGTTFLLVAIKGEQLQ